MSLQQLCQITLLVFVILGFVKMIYIDCNGKPEQKPTGFRGVITSLISIVMILALYYGAGLFSNLLDK